MYNTEYNIRKVKTGHNLEIRDLYKRATNEPRYTTVVPLTFTQYERILHEPQEVTP